MCYDGGMTDLENVNEFSAISPTSPEAQEYLREMKERAEKMGRGSRDVCACGHSMKYHHTDVASGYVACSPGRIVCGCKETRAVLRTSNLRRFLHKTSEPGYGMNHSLSKGVAAALGAGELVEWIHVVETGAVACDSCAGPTGFVDEKGQSPVFVMAFDRHWIRVSDGDIAAYSRVMCESCARGVFEHGIEFLSGASAKARV